LRKVRAGMVLAPGEGACRKVLEALLSALEVLHKEGVYHRDIAPDNILIGDDGAPVLLDFGAARRVIGEGAQKALTSIMKPHFAPLEQYADQSAMRQGPWTDLYALGGTIYFLLSGREPVPAASRALHDDQPRLREMGLEACSPHFLAVIDWMMAIKPPERPQSVHMLRDVLEGRITVPGRAARERTIPGVTARDTVDILTSPGDLTPASDAKEGAIAPTVLMQRETEPEPLPQPSAPVLATAAAAPRRSSMAVLAGLVVLNVLAWWWFTRGDGPARPPPASVTQAAPLVAAKAGAQAASAAGTTAAKSTPAAAIEPFGTETILSVLPARTPAVTAPLPDAAAATPATPVSIPRRALDAPLQRAAAFDAAGSRSADAAAKRNLKPATAGGIDPRARCGERNFFSMLVCLKRECQDPAASAHPECVNLREQERATRPADQR
jgi:hypothetical protein